jgi:hypothetical protein
MTKSKPKSCSCRQCKYARGRKGPNAMMKHEERAFRHNSKIAINLGKDESVTAAFSGARYG